MRGAEPRSKGVRYPSMVEEPTEAARGEHAAVNAEIPGRSGWVTTKVAAAALGVNPRTVRAYIERGDLEAKAEGEGVEKAYSVSIESVYALRDRRGGTRGTRERTREKSASTDEPVDITAIVRELTAELIRSTSEAAELRTRLELTESAQSTVREERNNLREERDTLREELRKERERALELEVQLRESRKGFWKRLFGG